MKTPRNKFEVRIGKQLSKSGIKYSYETEKIPYVIYGTYNPDFILDLPTGKKIYIETKGLFRVEAKRKMVAVKALNPSLDIRIVFYSSNKTNIRWCLKHKFPYSIGIIPEEWFSE